MWYVVYIYNRVSRAWGGYVVVFMVVFRGLAFAVESKSVGCAEVGEA
jgi:hypothetical protein